jgi:hypothetical protein
MSTKPLVVADPALPHLDMAASTRSVAVRPLAILRSISRLVAAESLHPLALKLTLLLLVLHGGSNPTAEVPFRMLCGAMLVIPSLVTRPLLWWCLTAVTLVPNAMSWYIIDNHKYLITYWVLTCALSLHAANPSDVLRLSGRALIAIVFVCAVAWKLLAGQFIDGSFLHFTFMVDTRVHRLGTWLSAGTMDETLALRDALAFMSARGMEGIPLKMQAAPSLEYLTLPMSWATLLIEALVAAVFVLGGRQISTWRHAALMAFIFMTYFLLPVVGFAAMLCIMGLSQCQQDDHLTKAGYLVLLLCVQCASIPWQTMFLPAM